MTWAQLKEAIPVVVAFALGHMSMAILWYGKERRRYSQGFEDGRRYAERDE